MEKITAPKSTADLGREIRAILVSMPTPMRSALAPACRDRLAAELRAVAAEPGRALASLAVLAVRDGEVVYEGQAGFRGADPADPARLLPAGPETLYRVASISKLVATLGFLRLVEKGAVDLDADANDALGFPLRNPAFPDRPVTPRMLLTHTSSLRDGEREAYVYGADTALADVLTPGRAAYDPEHWATPEAGADLGPGARFSYTNLNWGVLATLMERVSGQRFDRYMRAEVLAPLGIRGGYNPAELGPAEVADLATLYRKRDAAGRWDPAGPWVPQGPDRTGLPARPPAGLDGYVPGTNGTLLSPQGGLRISARGLGRILRLLLNGGELDGIRILRPDTVAAMASEQWRHDGRAGRGDTGNGQMRSWGLGAQRFTDSGGAGDGDRLVETGGWTGWGHLAEAYGLAGGFILDPAARNGVVYLIGGVGCDPETYPGRYSSFTRWEERILTALRDHALRAG